MSEGSTVRSKLLFFAATGLCSVALYFSICHLGMRQFVGYDYGAYTNSAWQMHLGYRPYIDSIGAHPPQFYVVARWAFDWFGVEWFSLVKMGALFAALTLAIHAWLLSRIMGYWWSVLLACFTQIVTNLLVACWSHDTPSIVISTMFYTAVLGWRARPANLTFTAVFLLGVALLLSKVNYAGLYYVFTLAGLIAADLCAPKIGLRKNLVLFGSMLLGAVATLMAWRISLPALFKNYGEVSDRALSLTNAISFLFRDWAWEIKQTAILLLPALVCVAYLCSRWCTGRKDAHTFRLSVCISRQQMAWLLLLAIGPAAAFVAKATNSAWLMFELPPVIISLAAGYVMFRDSQWTSFRRLAVGGLLLSIAAVGANAIRWSVNRLATTEHFEGNFYDSHSLISISAWPYFEGLMAGPKLKVVLDDMQAVLRDQGYLGKPDAKIYIGPRIDFGYAVFGIRPARGLPLFWDPFKNGNLKKSQAMVERFKQAGFERLIFLQDDHIFFPDTLVEYIHSTYQASTIGLLTVYRRL
jgi:hypothetical protein